MSNDELRRGPLVYSPRKGGLSPGPLLYACSIGILELVALVYLPLCWMNDMHTGGSLLLVIVPHMFPMRIQ